MIFKFGRVENDGTRLNTSKKFGLECLKVVKDCFDKASDADKSGRYWAPDASRQKGSVADLAGNNSIYDFDPQNKTANPAYITFYTGKGNEHLAICACNKIEFEKPGSALAADRIGFKAYSSHQQMTGISTFIIYGSDDFVFDGTIPSVKTNIENMSKDLMILPLEQAVYNATNPYTKYDRSIFHTKKTAACSIEYGLGFDGITLMSLCRDTSWSGYKIGMMGDIFIPAHPSDKVKRGAMFIPLYHPNSNSNEYSFSYDRDVYSEIGATIQKSDTSTRITNDGNTDMNIRSFSGVSGGCIRCVGVTKNTLWTSPHAYFDSVNKNSDQGVIDGIGFKGFIDPKYLKLAGGYGTPARRQEFEGGKMICPMDPLTYSSTSDTAGYLIAWEPGVMLP